MSKGPNWSRACREGGKIEAPDADPVTLAEDDTFKFVLDGGRFQVHALKAKRKIPKLTQIALMPEGVVAKNQGLVSCNLSRTSKAQARKFLPAQVFLGLGV